MRLREDQVRTGPRLLQQHFTIRSRRHHCDLQQRGERSCMARAPETDFLVSRDVTPIVPVLDDALLQM